MKRLICKSFVHFSSVWQRNFSKFDRFFGRDCVSEQSKPPQSSLDFGFGGYVSVKKEPPVVSSSLDCLCKQNIEKRLELQSGIFYQRD